MALGPIQQLSRSNRFDGDYLGLLAQGLSPQGDTRTRAPEAVDAGPAAAAPMRQTADASTQAGSRQLARSMGSRQQSNLQSAYTPAPSMQDVQAGRASLARGVSGDSVRQLQQQLNASGANLAVDGKFGPKTQTALRSFQRGQGVEAHGRANAQTFNQLDRAAQQPASSGTTGASQPQPQTNGPQATTPNAPAPGAPANGTATFDRMSKVGQRNQMAEGRITVNGNTYQFRSGGHGRGNLPQGEYTVTRHLDSRSDASMSVGGVGYSFAVSDKYDPRVGGTRSLLRIHPDGRSPGTEGCIGIVGDAATQRQFRQDMLAELRRNGGRYTLSVR